MTAPATLPTSSIPAPRPPTLGEIRHVGEQLHRALEDAVLRYRLHGASWSDVGLQLGISRQSAHERFRHLDGDDAGRVVLVIHEGEPRFMSERLGEPIAVDRARGVPLPRAAAVQLRGMRPALVGEVVD